MTVEKLNSEVRRAIARQKITAADVEAFRAATVEHSPAEKAALQALATKHRDLFEPAAAQKLTSLIETLSVKPLTPAPAPATSQSVSWDTFQVATDRASLAGPELTEALAAFDGLSSAVSSGKLSPADQLLLASAAARVGVLGAAQALRAVDLLATFSPADQAAFSTLAAGTTPLARAFLFEAVAAGYGVKELTTFEATIHGWSDAKLLETLNLADPIVEDGTQTGVKQQFRTSCVPTTGQALFGEIDPIYALKVRTGNADIHDVNEQDGMAVNPALAGEQKEILESRGGKAGGRAVGGEGTGWDTIDSVYNERSAQTGFVFSLVDLEQRPDLDDGKTLDAIAGQLERGVPTPLLVGIEGAAKIHAMIALEVTGTGNEQRFLIHDPWAGDTTWVTRAQFVAHDAPLGPFKCIGGYHQAAPAPLPAPK